MEKELKDEKSYEVVKYFDDYYDGVVRSGLTMQEAKDLRDKLSDTFSSYYSYSIRLTALSTELQTK